jgi:hypothetical protein
MLTLANDEAAELLIVLLAISEYLRSVDEPVPAFALRGVVDALFRATGRTPPDA